MMMDLLRDSLWQFVGAVLALLAIIISITIFFLQQRRKELSYKIDAETSLLSVSDELKEKTQVLYEGTPIHNVHLILVSVGNSGNVPIIPSDYDKKVIIEFNKDVQILSAEITDTEPVNIAANIKVQDSAIILDPILLNGGDKLSIKILAGEYDGKIKVDGRIVGVKEIKEKRIEYSTSTMFISLVGLMIVIIGAIGGSTTQSPMYSGMAATGLILILLPASYDKNYRGLLLRIAKTMLTNITEKFALPIKE